MPWKMSSPTQSEFEEYIERNDMPNEEQQEYEEYLENNHQIHQNEENNKFVRTFEGYHETIDMITYMIDDKKFIETRNKDICEALEILIARKEQIFKYRTKCCIRHHRCPEHGCLKLVCGCTCKCVSELADEDEIRELLVSEQNKIKKGKQVATNIASSSKSVNNDQLAGLNLPYKDGVDIFNYTAIGMLQLEVCLIHYKTQVETSIMREIEKEEDEAQKDILEQIYTMLQRI